MNKFALEPHDYRIYYVHIDLRHQYGISVAESQTFLLAKRPSAAMSEEKRLPFAGYVTVRPRLSKPQAHQCEMSHVRHTKELKRN